MANPSQMGRRKKVARWHRYYHAYLPSRRRIQPLWALSWRRGPLPTRIRRMEKTAHLSDINLSWFCVIWPSLMTLNCHWGVEAPREKISKTWCVQEEVLLLHPWKMEWKPLHFCWWFFSEECRQACRQDDFSQQNMFQWIVSCKQQRRLQCALRILQESFICERGKP